LKTYDMMFIFDTALQDEARDNVLTRIKDEIARLGGNVTQTELLGERAFARPMHKRDAGQYVQITIALDPSQVAPLQARLKLIDDIFRVQVLVADEAKAETASADTENQKTVEPQHA